MTSFRQSFLILMRRQKNNFAYAGINELTKSGLKNYELLTYSITAQFL